jgi:fructose-1-phosphate kinase PfkB-like protein
VLIAGPNLTIDRTSTIPVLRPGDVLRLADVVVTPGGKGLNVARAARALGVQATLVAFLPGHTGRAVAALIEEEGVTLRGVPVGGEIRSTAVILEAGGRATVLNEPGPPVDGADWATLEAAVADALPEHRVLVCSGSLPPGSPDDAYGRLADHARAARRPAVVDANGPTLRAALAAQPDVVTPNLAEAEAALQSARAVGASAGAAGESAEIVGASAGTTSESAGIVGASAGSGENVDASAGAAGESVEAAVDARPRAEAAATALVDAGARAAVVTAAAAGAAVADGARVAWIAAPRVSVRNPIGAGDVLTSALAAALAGGADVFAAARRGVAAAAASVEAPRAGELEPARLADLLS